MLISLMDHVLKILPRIIQYQIHKKCGETISDEQFGFRSVLGTRQALFCKQTLLQRCWKVRAQHGKMINTLKPIGIDDKDLRLLTEIMHVPQYKKRRQMKSLNQHLPIPIVQKWKEKGSGISEMLTTH